MQPEKRTAFQLLRNCALSCPELLETIKHTVLGKQYGSNRLALGHVEHFSTGSLTSN